MPISVADFQRLAQTASYANRSIVVDDAKQPTDIKFRGSVFSHSSKVNDATMKAFREALGKDPNFGAFGVHAFDTVLCSRAQLKKSLRACDIKAVFSQIEALKVKRFANEQARQMETNPEVLELTPAEREEVRKIIQQDWQGPKHDQLTKRTYAFALGGCKTENDVAILANHSIKMAIAQVKANHPQPAQQGNSANAANQPAHTGLQPPTNGEKQFESTTPMGLSRLSDGVTMGKYATSVEDHVRSGWIGTGMRANFGGTSRPVIFEKLKANGVEPGFIYHNDWSAKDTSALQIDTRSQATKDSIDDFIAKGGPDLQRQTQGKTDLEKGLIVGRAHPAGIAFAAEYVLSKELDKLGQDPKLDSPLLKAIKQSFPNAQKTDFFPDANASDDVKQRANANLARVKKDCFIALRDTVMNYGKTAAETDPTNSQRPVFKHFTDRHILKLDYNEGDRVSTKGAASTGEFRLPERVKEKGAVYYHRRVTTADKASIGAVSEAFANDLTRLLGVPAQELTLVRGQYSDGHPKIMLEAKFAEGYHDFEDGFIEDGRTIGNVEALGKFKAIFLALADRDAIGSHGQNKGVINGKFFAIDPGHSLEGNGKKLDIKDNLSFTDTDWRTQSKPVDHFTKRFRNYTIFDDDTRFAKMQGVIKLRDICAGHPNAIDKLANDYQTAFNPKEAGISPEEKAIRQQVFDNIEKMKAEFTTQVSRIVNICADQIALYDAFAGDDDLQRNAIETIENLEKFTSPTTWKSENGKVELKHLSVIEETRNPWTAKKVGNTLVYTSKKPIPMEMQGRLRLHNSLYGENTAKIAFRPSGQAVITVDLDRNPQSFFDAFSEDNVIRATHRYELGERRLAQRQQQQAVGQQPPAPPAGQQPPQAPLIDNPPPPAAPQPPSIDNPPPPPVAPQPPTGDVPPPPTVRQE